MTTTTDTTTILDFIRSIRASMTAERVDQNPTMADSANMDHWRCVLKAGRSRMTVYFSQGYGHNGKEPRLSAVLSCLADDAAGIANTPDFEDWCSDYGYDTDSRKAEKTFEACEREAERLRKFLGDSAYETLLWNVTRD